MIRGMMQIASSTDCLALDILCYEIMSVTICDHSDYKPWNDIMPSYQQALLPAEICRVCEANKERQWRGVTEMNSELSGLNDVMED